MSGGDKAVTRLEENKNKKMTTVLAALCFAMALALLLSAVGGTLAKYITSDRGNSAAVAAPFYFTSDKLSEDLPYYQVSEATRGESAEITFTISNFIDDLRCTSEAIDYKYWLVRGSGLDGESIATSEVSGTLSGEFKTEEIKMIVSDDNFDENGVVTVVVETSKPYSKVIGARFGYAEQHYNMRWSVEDSGSAVVLNISGGSGGTVTVAWPSGLTPDRTGSILSGSGSGSVSFTAQPGVSYALTFLKANSADSYSTASFNISVS